MARETLTMLREKLKTVAVERDRLSVRLADTTAKLNSQVLEADAASRALVAEQQAAVHMRAALREIASASRFSLGHPAIAQKALKKALGT